MVAGEKSGLFWPRKPSAQVWWLYSQPDCSLKTSSPNTIIEGARLQHSNFRIHKTFGPYSVNALLPGFMYSSKRWQFSWYSPNVSKILETVGTWTVFFFLSNNYSNPTLQNGYSDVNLYWSAFFEALLIFKQDRIRTLSLLKLMMEYWYLYLSVYPYIIFSFLIWQKGALLHIFM